MSEQGTEPFGFTVRHRKPAPKLNYPGGWTVALPHQCDAWDIHPGGYEPSPHADALAALDRFIAEAQQARQALAEQREFGDDAT